jgi:hypothetical protein
MAGPGWRQVAAGVAAGGGGWRRGLTTWGRSPLRRSERPRHQRGTPATTLPIEVIVEPARRRDLSRPGQGDDDRRHPRGVHHADGVRRPAREARRAQPARRPVAPRPAQPGAHSPRRPRWLGPRPGRGVTVPVPSLSVSEREGYAIDEAHDPRAENERTQVTETPWGRLHSAASMHRDAWPDGARTQRRSAVSALLPTPSKESHGVSHPLSPPSEPSQPVLHPLRRLRSLSHVVSPPTRTPESHSHAVLHLRWRSKSVVRSS